MSFPFELFYLVAKHLRNESQTLSSLARTSSRLYFTMLPTLYEQVELSSSSTITSFCETILGGPRQHGPFVKVLQIGIHKDPAQWLRLPKPLAVLLRTAFVRLPNLRDLSMITTTSAFYVFAGLEITFKLRRLQVPCTDSKPLYQLLSSQSSITELHLISSNPRDNACIRAAIIARPDILPRLSSITASLDVLTGIVPGRPISEILVESDAAALVHVPELALDSVFCGSTIPLRSVGYYHPAPHSDDWDSKDPWSVMITVLEDRKAHQTLAKIKLLETSDNSVPIGLELRNLIQWRMESLASIGGFDSLRRFEMELAYMSPLPETAVRGWIGKFRDISVWREYVPSLQSASVYGVEIQ